MQTVIEIAVHTDFSGSGISSFIKAVVLMKFCPRPWVSEFSLVSDEVINNYSVVRYFDWNSFGGNGFYRSGYHENGYGSIGGVMSFTTSS